MKDDSLFYRALLFALPLGVALWLLIGVILRLGIGVVVCLLTR